MISFRRPICHAVFACLLASPLGALALPYSATWNDASGDGPVVGDVVSARLSFDGSGNWQAVWQASSAHPFTGNLRFNLNLWDLAIGNISTAVAPQLNLVDIADLGSSSVTTHSYSGFNAFLANWHVGDEIITGDALVNASEHFNSGIVELASPFGRDNLIARAVVTGTVPEPGLLGLVLLGAAALFSRPDASRRKPTRTR